ncbi:YgiT-type zinc finger protein [Desulforamulus ruminis]
MISVQYIPFDFTINKTKYSMPNVKHEICSHCGEELIKE